MNGSEGSGIMWTLKFQRPDRLTAELIAIAGREAALRYGSTYLPVRDSGRIRFMEREEVLLILMHGPEKPPRYRVAAVEKDTRQSYFADDQMEVNRLAQHVRFKHVADAVMFHETFRADYGALEKQQLPRLISGSEDAQTLGIDLEIAEPEAIAKQNLWWQEWGGVLFTLSVNLGSAPVFSDWSLIGTRIGKYRQRPVYR